MSLLLIPLKYLAYIALPFIVLPFYWALLSIALYFLLPIISLPFYKPIKIIIHRNFEKRRKFGDFLSGLSEGFALILIAILLSIKFSIPSYFLPLIFVFSSIDLLTRSFARKPPISWWDTEDFRELLGFGSIMLLFWIIQSL